jgi:hypothetical protein
LQATGKSKICVWRWPGAFYEGRLSRDKTRPPGIEPLDCKTVDTLTLNF